MATAETQRGKEIYEFGPFRMDAEREVLWRVGEPVPLTPKAFQVLLFLVRHGNEVVSKDDLMQAVWPGTFVEEGNLSRNIFMLRKALGESPQDHRYILTVPGRGYRFAERVQAAGEQETTMVVASHSQVKIQVDRKRPWVWIAALAAVAIAGGAGAYRLLHSSAALGPRDSVVLADFANSTGDPVFDETLRQGMAVELEQSPFLRLVSEDRIRNTLPLMGLAADARLTRATARQICQRIGSAAEIDGAIARMGTQYVLSLHASRCDTGETIDDEQAQVARKEGVLGALSQMARRFRSRVGEAPATIQQHSKPLAEATTTSLEALKAYSAAWNRAFAKPQDALLLLQRAVQIDPNFAMAYALQGRLYADLMEPGLSKESLGKAYELRNRTSDRERFFIEANYESEVTGNLRRTDEICELWAQAYPRDAHPDGELSWIDQALGKYEESTEEARRAIDLDPDFTPGYNNLAWAYVLTGRLDEAERTLEQASTRKLEMPEMLVVRYFIAYMKGDKAGMERAAAEGQGQPGAEDWLLYAQATAQAYSGHLRQARAMTTRAEELARQANQPERAAIYGAGIAVREAFFGDGLDARRDALAARALSDDRDVEWGAALALALSGDLAQSEKLGHDLTVRFPEDTYVQDSYLPMLRAITALHSGDPAKELEILQPSARRELGVPGSWSGFFGCLYPIYFRGMADLAAHRGSAAAAEFQKLADHPGIVFTDPAGALVPLQLGRAYALAGEKTKALTSYRAFLGAWEDADPEISILKQAKAEYSKVH
jgi:eukaryotic-like serine/threonine-protein kinase